MKTYCVLFYLNFIHFQFSLPAPVGGDTFSPGESIFQLTLPSKGLTVPSNVGSFHVKKVDIHSAGVDSIGL